LDAALTNDLPFHALLDSAAQRWPARVALRWQGRDLTYGELRAQSLATAGALAAAGITRGERIAVFLANRPETIEVACAASRVGAIFVPVNSKLKARQLRHILHDAGCVALFMAHGDSAELSAALAGNRMLRLLVSVDTPVRDASIHSLSLEALRGARGEVPAAPDPTATAAIFYTSGSTGGPKGVRVSHRNLVAGAQCVADYLGNTPEDRILAALPLSFDYGLSQVSTAMQVGACAVLSNYHLPAALIQEVAAERITGLAGVPTMWAHLANGEWPAAARDSLRYLTNSGGALHPPTIEALRARLPRTRIFCMYGLTEAFRSTYLDPDELARRPGSIGKAIPHQEILLVDAQGAIRGPGESGELVHRGSLVAQGYWNAPELTARRFRPPPAGAHDVQPGELAVWSGDLVRADADGFLYFIGRADEQLKTSGHRVSPNEIEEVIVEVPGVLQAVIVGLPDAVLGHRLVAALVTAPGSAETVIEAARRHCRQQLPAYMVPAEFYLLDALPLSPNGKPDRAALATLLGSADSGGGGSGLRNA
jgi:acyl-CoA ligase (AMP-forming) (exosortase A-associated)